MKKIICLLLCLLPLIIAQGQTFQGQWIVGANLAQIDGDDLAGYNKLGLRAGLGVAVDIYEKWDVGLQLLWSERGSKSSSSDLRTGKLTLRYVELPLQVGYKDWWYDESYYKIRFLAGLSMGRLLSSDIDNQPYDVSLFKKTDVSFRIGCQFYATAKTAIELVYNRSFNPVFKGDDGSRLIGYFFDLALIRKI